MNVPSRERIPRRRIAAACAAAAAAAALLAGTLIAPAAPVKIVPVDDGGGGTPPACATPAIGCWKQLPVPGVNSVNMAALKTGKILLTQRSFTDVFQRYQIFDPATDTFGAVQTATVPHNLYCTGFDQTADGRILFAGSVADADYRKATIYDPAANSWTAQPDMFANRFYPTVTTLNASQLLVFDGDDFLGGTNPNIPEVFDVRTSRWIRLFGAEYGFGFPPPYDFDPPTYPRAHVISTGNVVYTGTRESWGAPDATRILDPIFQTWSAPIGVDPIGGLSGLMYERDGIMKAGPTDVYTLAATTPGATWRRRAPMNQLRYEFFMPGLPDGKVFAVGSVTTPEMYDPASNTWTNMAPAAEARGDHSATVLLPDARVLTAGPTYTAEVYSPPYLFTSSGDLAPRPVISSVGGAGGAGVIRYGETFTVTSPSAARVRAVRLIRLGAATHSWDMGQRSQPLAFSHACCDPALEPGENNNPVCFEGATCCASGQWACNEGDGSPTCASICGTLAVFAPQHYAQAPPGYYYLFILVGGVPSKAAIVKVE
jgi:hypothetical protein